MNNAQKDDWGTDTMTDNNQQVSFDDEMLILVDESDNVVGYSDKLECHRGEGVLHRAFSIFIFNDAGELLLQKRSPQKQLWPDYWSNSCCSHPRKGEELENSTQRRLAEELGISAPLKHLFTFQYHAKFGDIGSENEMCAVYIGKSNQEIRVNPNEISDWKYVSINDLTRELAVNGDQYSPWIKLEWERIMMSHMDDIKSL